MTALFDADHEYVSILSEIEGRSWQGASGYRDFLQTFGESLDFETALESATELDESRVLLEATVWSRGKSSEALVTERRWIVMTFRDKTVTRTQSYPSRQAALEAVGLEG
jgi:ketosteroid isomerase-like protein